MSEGLDVANYVFLDTGPLTLACKGPNNPKAVRCREWLAGLRASNFIVLIPEVADYEARREILRIGEDAKDWLARLDTLAATALLPLSRPAILKAAEFWALLRNQSLPTADPQALDCDAILAAQAVTAARPGDRVIVATTNVGHLNRFPGVRAEPWDNVNRPDS